MRRPSIVRRSVAEIAADPALRLYGCALALLHVLAFLHWRHGQSLVALLGPEVDPVCWPFFEACHRFRVLDRPALESVLRGYLGLGLGTTVLFLSRRTTGAAWTALLLLNVVKVLILVQDYRLRLNQHYMTLWVSAAFLFVPDKRRVLQYLIVAFYFWAGILKLDPDWFSGAALHGVAPLYVPAPLIPLTCAYVPVMELVVVFGLIARRGWIFWGAFAQLILFHVASWPIVRFFYPSLMFGILAIFPVARLIPAPDRRVPGLRPLVSGGEARTTYATLALFCVTQILPYLFPGDTAVTGEGRLFALHMFDASVTCRGTATVHERSGATRTITIEPFLPSRIECDPIVYLSLAGALCRRLGRDPSFDDMDLLLRAGRTRDPVLRPLVDVERFCHAGVTYDLWRHNAWIRTW